MCGNQDYVSKNIKLVYMSILSLVHYIEQNCWVPVLAEMFQTVFGSFHFMNEEVELGQTQL